MEEFSFLRKTSNVSLASENLQPILPGDSDSLAENDSLRTFCTQPEFQTLNIKFQTACFDIGMIYRS